MFPFNLPEFWEAIGVLVMLLALFPVLNLVELIVRIFVAAFIDRRGSEIFCEDPVFGRLKSWKRCGHWEGEIEFGESESVCVTLFIDATSDGPSEIQRTLLQKIRSQYPGLLPEIEAALRQYVGENWEFELSSISIPTGEETWDWSAGFFAETNQDGDMGYEVYITNGVVSFVEGSD